MSVRPSDELEASLGPQMPRLDDPRPGFKWPIGSARRIAAPAAEVWRVLSRPGNLEPCHPFCAKNPVHEWPGERSRDEIHYLSGWVFERRFRRWLEGVGYDLEIGRPGGRSSFVSWRILPVDAQSCRLRITVYPFALQRVPVAVRWLPHLLYLRPLLSRYLSSVVRGFEWFVTRGEPVPRNRFGRHPWFSERQSSGQPSLTAPSGPPGNAGQPVGYPPGGVWRPRPSSVRGNLALMDYRRIVVDRYGGPGVLRIAEEALPTPAAGEARVRVLTAGVSFADLLMREGVHPEARRPPFTPGWDLVGTVDRLGADVSAVALGQTVAALPIVGGYSESICLPARELLPVPAGLDPATVVSLVLNYGTAYQMMHRSARTKPGERALIHGAAGGVGTALLELGRLMDLEMYATASRPKHDLVARLGARPIDYQNTDFVEEVAVLTKGGGVDIVFDGIGGDHVARSYRTLRRGGRLVAYGHATSLVGTTLIGGKRSRLRGLPSLAAQLIRHALIPDGRRLGIYSIQTLRKRRPDWFREDMATLFGLLAEERLRPVVAERMPLAAAARAHQLLGERSVTGKIVLQCSH